MTFFKKLLAAFLGVVSGLALVNLATFIAGRYFSEQIVRSDDDMSRNCGVYLISSVVLSIIGAFIGVRVYHRKQRKK